MKKITTIFSAVVLAAMFTSCAVTLPHSLTDNPVGSKKGVSESTVLLGVIYLNGSYGLADACKKGRITGGVSTIDVKTTSYLLFTKKELMVTGE